MLRLNRSLKERIYLLLANQVSLTHWKFNVRGQSNRIYEQNLTPTLYSCSCPDHSTKHTFCKHLLFLLVRVATQLDLAEVITENKNNWNSVAFEICSSSWIERLKNHINNTENGNNVNSNAIGNDCSVCFEEMKENEKLVKCTTTCKNYFHDNCISMWLSTNHDTCPLCRAKWLAEENNDLVVNILKPNIINEPIELTHEPPLTLEELTSILTPEDYMPDLQQQNEIITPEPEIISEQNINTEELLRMFKEDETKIFHCDPNKYKLYIVDEDMNVSKFQIKNKIKKDRKNNIYYEFIKTEKIPFYKKVLLMDKNTNEIFSGDNTKKIANLKCSGYKDNQIKCSPTDIPKYYVFLMSFNGNTKITKNQKIIHEIVDDDIIDA